MSVLRLHAPATLALRRASTGGPSCRGGASSLLRVGQPTLSVLPMIRTLAQRMAARSATPRR
jgi:hypothetical protein